MLINKVDWEEVVMIPGGSPVRPADGLIVGQLGNVIDVARRPAGDEPLLRPAGVGIAAPAVDLFGPVQEVRRPPLPVGNMAAMFAPLNYGPPPAVLRRLPVLGRE